MRISFICTSIYSGHSGAFDWLELCLLVDCAQNTCYHEDVYPTTRTYTILTNSDSVSEYFAHSRGVLTYPAGGCFKLHCCFSRTTCYRARTTTQQGGDVFGQYDISVKSVLSFWLGVLPGCSFIEFLQSRSFCCHYTLGDLYAEHASRVCQWS